MTSEVSRFRYERKFQTSLTIEEALQVVRENPGHFVPAFEPRQVNNIYFDTPGFNFYYDNIEGERKRMKVRIRWYGTDLKHAGRPVLELKIKSGFFGEKINHPLKEFSVADLPDSRDLFAESLLPIPLRDMVSGTFPVLMNSYLRYYFISRNGKFRITVDDKLSYYPVNFGQVRFHSGSNDREHRIFEMKYDVADDSEASRISAAFPFRLTKNSKYLSGVERVCL